MPMDSAGRTALKELMLTSLKRRVGESGGDINDGMAVLALAFMETHAQTAILDGADLKRAADEMAQMLAEHYGAVYAEQQQVLQAEARKRN